MRQYSTHARLTDPQVSCAFLKFHAFTDLNIHCTGGCFNGNKQPRTTEHGLIISVQKTKLMAIKGRDPVRNKTLTDSKIIEKVNSFKYVGNLISCEKDVDIGKKLNDYLKITAIINNKENLKENKSTIVQKYNCTKHRFSSSIIPQ
jgi:hypothetical protein